MQKNKKGTLHKMACGDRKQLPEILSLEVNNPVACRLSKPWTLLKTSHSVNRTVSINHAVFRHFQMILVT